MAKKQPVEPTVPGELVEIQGTMCLRLNRPIAFVEYLSLQAMIVSEEERIGRRIVILPHSLDVVKA